MLASFGDGAPDDVFQFPDISRPVIGSEPIEDLWRNTVDKPLGVSNINSNQVFGEGRNVLD